MSLTDESGLNVRGLILAVFALLFVPVHGSSQITGQVLDQDGKPITLALVQLIGPSGVLASSRSNARGSFDFVPVATATEVRAVQFGFEEGSVGLGDLSQPLLLVLAPKPFQLEEIRAVAPEGSCPTKDDPGARAAWLRVLSGIRDLSNEGYWSAFLVEWRRSHGLDTDFGPLEEPSYDWVSWGASAESMARLWIRDGGSDLALARKRPPGDLDAGLGNAWHIAPLYASEAPLLLNQALASQSIIAWSAQGGAVVLCHEDDRGVKTRIAAALDGSGTLTDIVWKLETPRPVERAGGQITFPAPVDGFLLPLPATSYVWYREEGGRNSQDYHTFSPWFVGGTQSEVTHALALYRESLKSGIPEH